MKSCLLLPLMLVITLFPCHVFGQKDAVDDGPVGIFQSRGEYRTFMGSVKQAAYGEGGNVELRSMVPMINDMVLGQEFGTTSRQYGGNNVGPLDLLADPKVREDLDMVDEQYEELQKLNADVQKRAAEQIRGLDFSDSQGLVEQLQKIRRDARRDLESLFIPEQLQRLEQIRNQSRLRGQSLVDLLTSDPLRDQLEITEAQEKELREEEDEIREEMEREIAKLRKKARERLLSKLDTRQRDQVDEIFGESFEFAKSADQNSKRRPKAKGKGK